MLIPLISESQGDPGDTVALPNAVLFNFINPPDVAYSGLKFDNDGNMYRRQAGGGWSSVGAWLLNGTASDFYITRAIVSGTLTTDAGAGPLQLNVDREYDIQGTANDVTEITVEISNDISGTPILVMRNYTFEIEVFA